MRKLVLLLSFLFFVFSFSYSQFEQVINPFDEAPADTNYWAWFDPVGAASDTAAHFQISDNANADSSFVHVSYVTSPVMFGAGAMKLEYSAQNIESWGGYAKLEHWHPDSNAVYDFSGYDSISLYYYNEVKQSLPGRVELRFNLHDVSNSENGNETYSVLECEYYYSFHHILDGEPGWHEIKMPLAADPNFWNGEGFNLTGWTGIDGNVTLDCDKIKGFSFEFSISGGGEGDRSYGTVILDHLALKGVSSVEIVFFNGKAIPGDVTLSPGWGGGSYEITDEEASAPGTNSIKWITPLNDWAIWDGLVFTLSNVKNLMVNWPNDSLHFMIKADAGLDSLKLVLSDDDEDGDGPDLEYEAFYMLHENEVGYDGTWKEVNIALQDFDRSGGAWNGSQMVYDKLMDSTRVKNFKILVGSINGIGKVVYLDDIWTGTPEFDWIPPEAVTGVSGIQGDYYNLVIWEDVPGENGESYDLYASEEPITDIEEEGVELVTSGISEGIQTAIHYIYYPLTDYNVTYYYAVTCKDASGNEGPAGLSTAVTNTAKGIPTISLDVPAFTADGDLSEWYNSEIIPWVLKPEEHYVPVGTVNDSTDLKCAVFLAVDDSYFYIAADVIDNVYHYGEGNWWDQDALEFFFGLYDSRGSKHSRIQRGIEPDYKLYFTENGIVNDYNNQQVIYTPDDDNYHFEDFGGVDYVIEAKVPLDSIAFGDDIRFHPKRGMRIPLELYFHDNDGTGPEGNLAWSPFNTDHAWQYPTEWRYTWIGDTTHVVGIDRENRVSIATEYGLEQNYPNPFNPATKIQFSIKEPALVTLEVYNILGQRVGLLVNEDKIAGKHSVIWDANNLPSGIYFYRLQANDFSKTRKMLLVK